jgi:hypothetical protein
LKPHERQDFLKLVSDVHSFYKQSTSPFVLDVWWNVCQKFEFEQVQKAFSAHAANPDNGQFMPKPADLIKVLQGTTRDKAAIAWGKALKAISDYGHPSDVCFDDPAIHAAIQDMGGWPRFCSTETKDLSYAQHRFCELHRAYTGRGSFEYPARLVGSCGPDNAARLAARGLPEPKPKLIGDKEAALRVLAGGAIGKSISLPDLAQNALQLEAA